mgnify:FL=1
MPEDSTKVELLECVCLQVAKDLEVRDFTALDELLKYNTLDEIRAYISNLEIEENYNK